MKKYLLIYRAVPEPASDPSASEQEMQDWSNWFDRLKKEGVLADIGAPVMEDGKVVLSATEVADKPMQTADGNRVIAYSIILADNIDEAVRIVRDGPAVKYKCTVEVREVIKM